MHAESQLDYDTAHVFHPGCSAHSCRSELGRGHDLSLSGLGSVGQGAEGGAGVYGALSIRCAPVSSHRLDRHGDTPDDRSDVAVSARRRCWNPFLMAQNRHGEADAGCLVAVPHFAA